jgi:hypothetical protein
MYCWTVLILLWASYNCYVQTLAFLFGYGADVFIHFFSNCCSITILCRWWCVVSFFISMHGHSLRMLQDVLEEGFICWFISPNFCLPWYFVSVFWYLYSSVWYVIAGKLASWFLRISYYICEVLALEYLFIYLFLHYRSLLHDIGQVSYCTLADYNKRVKLQYLQLFTIDYSRLQ